MRGDDKHTKGNAENNDTPPVQPLTTPRPRSAASLARLKQITEIGRRAVERMHRELAPGKNDTTTKPGE